MERNTVDYGPPVPVEFAVERITATAGHTLRGGSGASCWGYNQSNIVRCGAELYALSWRDDLSLRVYRRLGPGEWAESAPLPPVPQNGNVLVDGEGRVHVVSGANASWHAVFDAQLRGCEIREHTAADSRFGAAMGADGRIFAAGGLERMAWYVLDPERDYRPLASGAVPHERQRGYNFTVLHGRAAHAFCSDDYFVRGEQYPNDWFKRPHPETGEVERVETPRGIYPVLKSYYYYCADVLAAAPDWRMQVISDVADTFTPADGARGTTEQQDMLLDDQGRVHLIYFENRQRVTTVWAAMGQDHANSRLYHAMGPRGGPFEHRCLGSYNSGRLHQSPDGRMHFLLTRGRRGAAEELHYAVGEPWGRISEPVPLAMPGRFWHAFISTRRAGGTPTSSIDCYWTGAYESKSNEVWYGRLTEAGSG